MGRTSRSIAGSIVLVLQIILRMSTTIVVMPLLLRVESQETLGSYSVILQFIAYLQLLELGMSRAIGREFSQCSEQAGQEKEFTCLASSGLVFLFGVGVVVGLLTVALAWTLPLWLTAEVSVLKSASYALLIFALWMPARFPLSLFHLFLFARQRIALYGGFAMVGDMLRTGLSLVLVWEGFGLPGLALASVAAELLPFSLSWYWTRGEWAGSRWWTAPNRSVLYRLLSVGFPLSLMSIGDRLTFYSQDIIVGWLFDAKAVAALYTTRMPGFLLASIIWRMMESIVPGINELYSKNLFEIFGSAHYRLVSYALGLGLWLAAGIYTFNKPVVEFWVGEALYTAGGVTTGVSFLALVATLNNILTHFLIVEGRLRHYPCVVVGAGLAAVGLAVVMGYTWGLAGVMWSTGIAHALTTFFLLYRTRLMLKVGLTELLTAISLRALRCALAGVGGCVLYLATLSVGMYVPWFVGVMAVTVVGLAGFIGWGLVPEDGHFVLAMLKRIPVRAGR
jgi:O-antigen/teichoic acid export membrane protein